MESSGLAAAFAKAFLIGKFREVEFVNASPWVWEFATRAKVHSAAWENEDALGVNPTAGRFAIADGASESWQSGAWSRHLVACYLKNVPTPNSLSRWLSEVRQCWSLPTLANEPNQWYAEAKASQGSFATLLGIEFHSRRGNELAWRAVAIGDSCLLCIRDDVLQMCWPLERVEDFSLSPSLVGSSASSPPPSAEWLAGRCQAGDVFVLATDAVAAGLLQLSSPRLWQRLRLILQRDSATDRRAGLLQLVKACQRRRNDDATLIAVLTTPSPADRR